LVYLVWRKKDRHTVIQILAGFVPFILWECFALIYYGFPFPNIAYAKLNTGIPRQELILRGLQYLHNSLRLDPVSLPVVFVSSVSVIAGKDRRQMAVGWGGLLYLLFVVSIGGDFMSGRFIAAPFLIAALLLAGNMRKMPLKYIGVGTVLVPALSLAGSYSPLTSGVDYGLYRNDLIRRGIGDERGTFYQAAGLLRAWGEWPTEFPRHPWAERGRLVRKYRDLPGEKREGYLIASDHNGVVYTTWISIGYSGFFAGPDVHIVDALALSDPLLARLPAYEDPEWMPGHFTRIIPEGYVESLTTGQNVIVDQKLARLYEKIKIITRGELFSWERWGEIWRMNTGQYEHLVDFSAYRYPGELWRKLSEVAIRPADPLRQFELARTYFKIGEAGKALDTLEKGLELNPSSFANFYQVARILYENEKPIQALNAYQEALRLISVQMEDWQEDSAERYREYLDGRALIYLGLGTTFRVLGKIEAALQAYQLALADKPEGDPSIFHNIGAIRLQLGDEAGAIEAFGRALELGSRDGESMFALASLYWRRNQHEQAQALFERALNEADPEETRFDVYMRLGKTFEKLNRWEEAVTAYKIALIKRPDDPVVLAAISSVSGKQQD